MAHRCLHTHARVHTHAHAHHSQSDCGATSLAGSFFFFSAVTSTGSNPLWRCLRITHCVVILRQLPRASVGGRQMVCFQEAPSTAPVHSAVFEQGTLILSVAGEQAQSWSSCVCLCTPFSLSEPSVPVSAQRGPCLGSVLKLHRCDSLT